MEYSMKRQFPFNKKLCKKYLGTLKDIIIYPIDGGYPWHLSDAFCSVDGLVSLSGLFDRGFVAYLPFIKEAFLNVHKPELGNREIFELIKAVEMTPHKDFSKPIVINYLGNPMTVQDMGDRVAIAAARTFGMSLLSVRIGYCSQENRRKFDIDRSVFSNSKNAFSVDNLSSYYSNYTLVSSTSLKDLEKQIGIYTKPSVFRANLVIEGVKPFIEDDPSISCLEIGMNMFSKLLPCTHTPIAFLNQAKTLNCEKIATYCFLKRYRSLKHFRPVFHQYDNPTVGINMSLISGEGQIIQRGDVVTAHYIF